MEMGQDLSLSTNITKDAVWQSSDDTVVKATSAGKLFALKEGAVTVTLTAGSKTDSITVTVITQPTMWTIGDSIFDFNDNGPNTAIPLLVEEAGYINSCMDNIAGSTVHSGKGDGNSILEHTVSGMYEGFYNAHGAPDLILIFRGTNDVNHGQVRPDLARKKPVEQAIKDVCAYFSTNYPNARIVWATPLWRETIDLPVLDEFRQLLHDLCPQYGVEVFDLHLVEPFASLDGTNYKTLLPDGVHPSHRGSFYMKDAFVAYLTGK
jgi:lysophospholipase L1-like esterase